MDPDAKQILVDHLVEKPLHALHELAEALVEKEELSEQGLVQLGDQLKRVNVHHKVLIGFVDQLINSIDNHKEIQKQQQQIIAACEKIIENFNKSKYHADRVQKCFKERNEAIRNVLRVDNAEVMDEALAQTAADAVEPPRRSKRHDPYGREAKERIRKRNLRRQKEVVLKMNLSDLQGLLKVLA